VTITIRPLTAAIGAEVAGVDLTTELDDETADRLRNALLDHLVLFFRDQPMTPVQQLRFAEQFAPVMLPLIDTISTEQPGVTVLDQTAPKGQYTERWHADSTFLPAPPMGAVLRAVQVPSIGGDTCWASMYAAYEALSPAVQLFIDGLHAYHSTAIIDAALAKLGNVVRRDAGAAPVVHPVVRVHPETGRKAVFVNGNFTTGIVELSADESRTVLAMLYERMNAPDVQVRWRWAPASVAIWDNRATQHCAIPDYTERRIMHRCMMVGSTPVGPGDHLHEGAHTP
jgi:taurine dioxygenase